MRFSRFLICLVPLAEFALPQPAAAQSSDSIYSSPDLSVSSAAPWVPAAPVPPARPWETALRFPGRIVSLPFVVMGNAAERSMVTIEENDVIDRVLVLMASRKYGILGAPAALGGHSGLGGELIFVPPGLGKRLRFDVAMTVAHYNRERVSVFAGPLRATYMSEWRPQELYFGTGITAPLSGESSYAKRAEAARLMLTWGWVPWDSAAVQPLAATMFGEAVRGRSPMHRAWVGAWAGPRYSFITRGRDEPSFELAHPAEAAGSLDRRVEHFAYGAGVSYDTRRGRPHWSSGWRGSAEVERFGKPIEALALKDARGGARSFTRATYRADVGSSFGRDARTLRLALTAVDQTLDAGGGAFLIGDLQTLGSSSGLAGFEADRFRDVDLATAKLSYIFPLVKNLEFDLHTETGGVYPDLWRAQLSALETSFGAALRIRDEFATYGAIGMDWSSERMRVWVGLGGVE